MIDRRSVYRTVDRVLNTVRLGSIYGIRLDTNPVPADWTHITKIDPESKKKVPIAFSRYLRYTDAVSVGGSADVTDKNTVETFRLLEYVSTPAFHEPSEPQHVTEESQAKSEFLAVPQVLNGTDEAFVADFGAGVEYIRETMAPALLSNVPLLSSDLKDRLAAILTGVMLKAAVTEAYIIQNPESAAARESGVTEANLVDPGGAKHRGLAAEHVLQAEILYLEYSGTFGGEDAAAMLEAIASGLEWTRLWYGGGIDTRDKTAAMLEAGADAVVVGDVFHRIATEETALTNQYLNDRGPDATAPGKIGVWVEQEIDVSETAAAQYLSTIPSVTDPIATAQRCLCSGVRARSRLRAEFESSSTSGAGSVGESTLKAVADAIGGNVTDPKLFSQRLIEAIRNEEQSYIPASKFDVTVGSS